MSTTHGGEHVETERNQDREDEQARQAATCDQVRKDHLTAQTVVGYDDRRAAESHRMAGTFGARLSVGNSEEEAWPQRHQRKR